MKFKQSIKSIFVILLTLFVGVNFSYGQVPMGGIDPENPATWFYVNLTAQPSTHACGTNPGQVWLHSVTPSGEDSNPYVLPAKPANPYAEKGTDDWDYRQWSEEHGFSDGMNDAKNGLSEKSYRPYYNESGWTNAVKEGYDAGWDWYKSGHYLNPTNPVGFAESVSSKGYTVVYAPGFEDLMGFSSYASFYGKAQENDGWYFTGWSFTDGDSDLGVGDENGTLFRILPSATAGEANIRNEYVYATFKPVLVSDYKVNGLINTSVSNTTTVVFDAVGERVSASDFTALVAHATEGDNDSNWQVEIDDACCPGNKITVRVTYNGSANGEFRGNVTLASKSGCSQLTAPVYARVGADATSEATLYDGKTPTSISGTLEDMISEADGKDLVVMLNKNYTENMTVKANVTLNFNGYTINNLNVTGGKVTIAYDKYGSSGAAVSVKEGTLILNGGEFASLNISAGATVEQNGATITGTTTNNGTLVTTEGRFEGGLTSSGSLTVNGGVLEGVVAITITNGTATINKAAISGKTTGVLVTGGTTTIASKLVSVYGGINAVNQTAGSITLQNGKFDGTTPLAGIINLQSGYFKKDGANLGIAIPSGKKVLNVLAGSEYAEGYRYFVGDDATSVGVCRIGTTSYATLEAALAYANNNPTQEVVIIMTNDYTLPAGYYTLPARATLIVPMSDEQETGYEIVNRVSNNSVSHTDYVIPYEFRRLTFAEGVNMDVYGTIELTGTQRASDDGYAAMPHGAYGHLVMEAGSHMTLQNGSLLRAWGFMTGKGETDARRGSKVREQFQMGDWKGGSASFDMLDLSKNPGHVFPISQYFIQNVESPVKYHPGAILSTTTSVSANFASMGITAMANDIIIVGVSGGDPAMFFMDQEADAENTWVRKWYDAEHDVQTYDVNSGAHIGSMVLDLGKLGTAPLKMNSGMFVLPITNNMKIHLLSGSMDFTQVTSLLPGAEVEVDKESTVTIYSNPDSEVFSGALIIYDKDQWGNYAQSKGDTDTKYTKVVKYSPSWDGALVAGKPANGKPTVRHEDACPDDASINVHGTFATGDGYLLTTEGGANIFSSNEDAGTFICSQNPPSDETLAGLYVLPVNNNSAAKKLYLAKLKNADQSYTETNGAGANQVFMYRDNAWQAPVKDNILTFFFDCYTAEVDMNVYFDEADKKLQRIMAQQQYPTQEQLWPTYDLGKAVQHIYIKPQEWLEIAGKVTIEFDYDLEALMAAYTESGEEGLADYWEACANTPYLEGVEGNADNTYSDADGAGRLFILISDPDCQWWEVEKKDNLYHCIHPNNDTYYYWDEVEEKWMEKRFTITWKNWDGTIIKTKDMEGDPTTEYSVTYGTMAEFLGTNPTREPDIDYTYDFTGWSPELAPVTSDVTYTATYEKKERKYTITFLQEGGVEIERQFLPHNAVPVCENTPTKIGHTLVWSPAIAAVTGDATYTATWEEEPPTEYQVTFYDYDGTTPLQQSNVAVGTMPEYESPTPIGKATWAEKQDNKEYTYVFDHWSPEPEIVSATSIKSYIAVYREVVRNYTISYYKEDGTTLNTTEQLPYGATPTPPTVTKENPETGHTYTLVWKTLDESGGIQTVMGEASYKPTYLDVLNKYTVTVKSNPSGACSICGAGLYDYNTPVTLTLTVNDGYTFTGWSDGEEGTNTTRTINVTEDKELVANFTVTKPDCAITWKGEDGNTTLAEVGQKAGTATVYTGETPTKATDAQYTYTFDGWTTSPNGAGTFYKNNMTPKATADATYYAHFAATTLPDLNVTSITTLTQPVTYKNLVITSNGSSSGQLINPDYLTITGNAYFDLTLNANAETWYAFGLPWQVNTNGGMKADGANLAIGKNCYILVFDGAARAAGTLDPRTNSYWTYVDAGATLEEGKLYMIYLRNAASTIRFTKATAAPIVNNTITLHKNASSATKDAGWNAIANPTLAYAVLASAGITKGQKYIPGVPTADGTNTDRYEVFEFGNEKLIVGQPFFVQADADKTLVANEDNVFSAPRREMLRASQYEVRIAPKNADYTDRIYVIASEEKEDQYVIGQDLGKISIANGIPQMWINRYDTKLSANTQAMINNQATFPLGISIPVDGAYTIHTVTEPNDDEELFVTINGAPVWNLTTGQYTLNLAAGNTNEYGLLVVYHPAPEISTGCDQLQVTDKPSVRKVLINGQVFIIRDGAVYTIFGQKAK